MAYGDYQQTRSFRQRLWATLKIDPEEEPNVILTLALLLPLFWLSILGSGLLGTASAAYLGTDIYKFFGL